MLTPGFLAHKLGVGPVTLSVRNLGPNDFFMLQHRVPAAATERDWKQWIVATCVWMINGQLTLGHANAPVLLHHAISGLPKGVLDVLYHTVLGLSNRKDKAIEAIEAFCLEASSRALWKQLGQGGFPRDSFSGVPGAEKLGSNVVQRLWTVYNEFEDQRIVELSVWAQSKFMVSPHAPKGIKSLDAKDRQQFETEKADKQRVLDRFFYTAIGLYGEDGKKLKEFDLVQQASTPEELEDEMKRWLAGDMDAHDRVVTEYKAKIVAKKEAGRQERQQRLAAARERAQEAGEDTEAMSLIGYAPEQVRAVLEQRRGGRPAGAQFIADGKHDYVYEKYLSEAAEKGPLRVVDGQIEQIDSDPDAINRQLAGRKVKTTHRREDN